MQPVFNATEVLVSSDSLIRVMCPNLGCQRILAVPASARGKVVRCGACGLNVRIPMPKTTEAPGQKPGTKSPGPKPGEKAA